MSSLYDQLQSAEQSRRECEESKRSIQAEISQLREKIESLANTERTPLQDEELQSLKARLSTKDLHALEIEKNLGSYLANEQGLRKRCYESDGETPPKRLRLSLASTPLANHPGNTSASETTRPVPSRTHYVLRKDHAAFVSCRKFLEMVAEYLSRFYIFTNKRYRNPTFGDFLYAYHNPDEATYIMAGLSDVLLPDVFTTAEWRILDKLNATVNAELHTCLVPDKKNKVDIVLPSILEGGLGTFEKYLRSIGKLVYGDEVVMNITGSHDISVSSESTGSSSSKNSTPSQP